MRFSIVLVKSFFQQLRLDLVSYYCRYLRTHKYSQSSLLFTLSDDRKYGCVCRLLHAIVVVQCGKDLTKMNVCYVLVQSIDDLKKHEKVAALESWRFDSILCR